MDPTIRAANLEVLREEDEISSVAYAVEIVQVWAALKDQVQPLESGTTNTAIVEAMLGSEERRRAAFEAGYTGRVRFPLELAWPTANELEAVFGGSIHKHMPNNISQTARRRSIEAVTVAAVGADSAEDATVAAYLSFADRIIGTHAIYQYLDRRVSRNYKAFAADPEGSRVMPGREEMFWGSALFGAPFSPGVFDTQGALTRLMQSISATAHDFYEDNADQYLDAWWAAVNLLREEGGTYSEAVGGPLTALINRDLGTARYLLKQRLFNSRELLPHRSRAKFELDADEEEYFAELLSEPEIEGDEPATETPSLSREELVKLARDHVGALLSWEGEAGVVSVAYARQLAVNKRVNSKPEVVRDPEGPYSLVPLALILDYFRRGDGVTIQRHRMGGRGNFMSIERFGRLVQADKMRVLDVDDRYLDRDIQVFRLPS